MPLALNTFYKQKKLHKMESKSEEEEDSTQSVEYFGETGSSLTYQENKVKVSASWKTIASFYAQATSTQCWITKVPGVSMEQTPDGYWRLRWEVDKLDDKGNVLYKVRKVTSERSSNTKVKVKLTLYLHHLALLEGGQQLVEGSYYLEGNIKKEVKWSVSHLCGESGCYNPNHLVHEPHPINIDRIGCCSTICAHTPKCLVSKEQRQKKTELLYNKYLT